MKELKQWDPLSYLVVNNAIRVTDCQEGVELKLPPMCVCVYMCVSGTANAHTPDAGCMTHLMSLKSFNAHSASSQPSRDPFNLQTGDME